MPRRNRRQVGEFMPSITKAKRHYDRARVITLESTEETQAHSFWSVFRAGIAAFVAGAITLGPLAILHPPSAIISGTLLALLYWRYCRKDSEETKRIRRTSLVYLHKEKEDKCETPESTQETPDLKLNIAPKVIALKEETLTPETEIPILDDGDTIVEIRPFEVITCDVFEQTTSKMRAR